LRVEPGLDGGSGRFLTQEMHEMATEHSIFDMARIGVGAS